MSKRPNWKRLRVGDKVRIVSIPTGDQAQYERDKDPFTVRLFWRLIRKRSVITIFKIDEFGSPWFGYKFRNGRGTMEYHYLSIRDNESWVLVRPHCRAAPKP